MQFGRPKWPLMPIGRSRTFWIATLVALAVISLVVLPVLALLLAVACYYLVAIRSRLKFHRT